MTKSKYPKYVVDVDTLVTQYSSVMNDKSIYKLLPVNTVFFDPTHLYLFTKSPSSTKI